MGGGACFFAGRADAAEVRISRELGKSRVGLIGVGAGIVVMSFNCFDGLRRGWSYCFAIYFIYIF